MREFWNRLSRKLYLWQNQLNILPAERTVITILLAILIIMTTFWVVLPPQKTLYDQEDYAQLHQLFKEKSAEQKKEYQRIAQRYNPADENKRVTELAKSEREEAQNKNVDGMRPPVAQQPDITPESKSPPKKSAIDERQEAVENSSTTSKSESQSQTLSKKSSSRLHLNTATHEQLTQLPGIGPVIAERIVEYRRNNGYFIQLSQLKEIKGIGPARFSKIRSLVTITDKN
ncbi:MAG: ComEA family DNA-binding protein [Bacteroidota bacterium]